MNKWLMKLVNSFGFTVALLVELAIMSFSMSLLGYQLIVKIGFILIGSVVVLFAVNSWIKGNKPLWLMFALVSIFFSWSFALVGTDVQTEASETVISLSDDETLRTIRQQLEQARMDAVSLQEAFDQSGREGTIDSVLRRQELNNEKIANLEKQETDRIAYIESGKATNQARGQAAVITSEKIFSAIPDAIKAGRWIHLFIFGLIFIGLEITIITAVEEEKKNIHDNEHSVEKVEGNEKLSRTGTEQEIKTNESTEKYKQVITGDREHFSKIIHPMQEWIDDVNTGKVETVKIKSVNPDLYKLSDINPIVVSNIIHVLTDHDNYPNEMRTPEDASEFFSKKHNENPLKFGAHSVETCRTVWRWIYQKGLMGKKKEEIQEIAKDGNKQ